MTPVLLAGTDGNAREPFFSADGEWIGFFSGGVLRRVATSGGAAATVGGADNPFGSSWGADGLILYGQGPGGIWRVPGTGGTPEAVITVEDGESAHGPQMLLDGEWVLFTLLPAGGTDWDEAQIVMQSLESGDRVMLIEGGRDGRYVETGHLVYALNGVLFAVAVDLDARQVLGGPMPLVEGVRQTGVTGTAQFSIADNGTLVYVPGGAIGSAFSLAWVSLTGESTPLAAPSRNYGDIRVSPDGTRAAVTITEPDNSDVWIWRLDQGPLTRLTFGDGSEVRPLWTPDSERVLFNSTRDGGGLFWKAADGTGEVERLLEQTGRVWPAGWTTDGRIIISTASGEVAPTRVRRAGPRLARASALRAARPRRSRQCPRPLQRPGSPPRQFRAGSRVRQNASHEIDGRAAVVPAENRH